MAKEKIKIQYAEDWVNTMPVQPTPGGTLHIHAELNLIITEGISWQRWYHRELIPLYECWE